MRFYTSEQLGPQQRTLANGTLLCEEVPIARTGQLLYADGEVPVEAGKDGIVKIEREPDEVFSDVALSSFNGVPVANDHPPLADARIDPSTWKKYAVGTVLNARRGPDPDCVYADLLIQDEDAIRDVRAGKREVSAGYDADYETIEPGRGRQRNILGNHVALVDKGRCGPRCAIGDHDAMANKAKVWMDRFRKSVRTRDEEGAVAAIEDLKKDPDMLGDIVADDGEGAPAIVNTEKGENGETHHHVTVNLSPGGSSNAPPGAVSGSDKGVGDDGEGNGMEARMDALEQDVASIKSLLQEIAGGDEGEGQGAAEEDRAMRDRRARDEAAGEGNEKDWPEGKKSDAAEDGARTGDKRRSARDTATVDSTGLRTEFMDVLSRAELLVPGVKLPTFDSRARAAVTTDEMCDFRRRVLSDAWRATTTDGRDAVEAMLNGARPLFMDRGAMTCDQVKSYFDGASTIVRKAGRSSQRVSANDRVNRTSANNGFGAVQTPAEINALQAKHWGRS